MHIGVKELIEEFIKKSNARDGVELIEKPNHAFKCLKCGKIYAFKYDAQKCQHPQ